ncbi:antibiotic biosynthesis monooxygenase [Pedosphaera parvula]|uniref:ABM domain-containing protein n=1 Tax=Pedosphaera parvula (strain Ellin514) TaxID=320771 RepID=B9XNW7_PEDPL|nr:antibiotic biosynthesis monooxygenase [Pedosphaera parvula]EEF58433.1 conserved hypothetical protein [Pedosphaera parvula Ellin514]
MNAPNKTCPIHVAITRRVKPGCETEFEAALRQFLKSSFAHRGVQGANMIVPSPGSESREYGILRTFTNEHERDAFYESSIFKEWNERIQPLTEGEPEHREITGLEAWFRSPQKPPPRWKMAFLTWVAVWPVSMAVPAVLSPLLAQGVPPLIFAGVVALGIVIILTWGAMPLLVRVARGWL